jgi:hypothetical protein
LASTLNPPADSPKIVTLPQLPPNAPILRPDPFQRELLIHQAIVGIEMPFRIQGGLSEEA